MLDSRSTFQTGARFVATRFLSISPTSNVNAEVIARAEVESGTLVGAFHDFTTFCGLPPNQAWRSSPARARDELEADPLRRHSRASKPLEVDDLSGQQSEV